MASTNFTSGTVITSTWLNQVDSHVFGVQNFGAVGDGVTDDTAAIQAAIDAAEALAVGSGSAIIGNSGYTVYIPPGNYLVSSPLTVTVGGIGFYSDPSKGARIFTSNSSGDIFTIGDASDTSSIWENHFHNLFFEATNKENTGVVALHFYRCFGGSIVNCTFHGCYESIVGERMNRYVLSNCNTFQNRATNIAASSFRFKGLASGTGGGMHITNCELAGGGTLTPSVTAQILCEEIDGLYGQSIHTRDCSYGIACLPTGVTGKNIIDTILLDTCYFDENYTYCAYLGGTVATGGRYQHIKFDNCYFRASNLSENGLRVEITDSGTFVSSGGAVEDITITGGAIRQATSRGILVVGSGSSKLEPYGFIVNAVDFRDNNFGNTALNGTAISAACESLVVSNCEFHADANAGTNIVQATLSDLASNQPTFICTGNNFSFVNCTDTNPINHTTSSTANIEISGNLFATHGQHLDQVYKVTTTDASTTTLWTWTIPTLGTAGFCQVSVVGHCTSSEKSAAYLFESGFRRNSGGASLSTGTSDFTSVRAWNPDAIATIPTAQLASGALRVQVTGVAAETWEWTAHVILNAAK